MMFLSFRELALILLCQLPWLLSDFYYRRTCYCDYSLGQSVSSLNFLKYWSRAISGSEGKFTVLGPQQPITALVGGEAIFHCHLYPQKDARDMEVMWFHEKHSGLIHHYRDEQDQMQNQLPEYQGRTEFLRENISSGNVTLKLSNISLSDEGKYLCKFSNSIYSHEAEFQVYVSDALFPRTWITLLFICGCLVAIFLFFTNYNDILREVRGYTGPARRLLEERGWNGISSLPCMQEQASPEDMQKEQKEMAFPSLLCHHEVVLQENQREMELNLSPTPDILKRPGLQTAQKHRVDITLDVDTAHPFLLLRMDGKSVISCSHKLKKSKHPERFENLVCVLGKERFTSGQCYWEVNVEDKMKWILGFCKDSVCRKVGVQVTPENGFWTISLKKGNTYWALSNPQTHLCLAVAPKIVGIFLYYEAGCISFYNVTDGTHIYTFQDTFNGALRPCIFPGQLSIWENIVPITIPSQSQKILQPPQIPKHVRS
ncbi:erythroid membrane-associated protein-like isoform X2 [Dromiciops gliroides]|uniref:erythroid membrane-associated protein-like isoform X2 n=1 Tax=Dromiciops gliroides TaxID=33562 RepID=UPI001CC53963|nr:erythroid membrane-associated protein-like isoform X2 [Dromiciops gliroides]